jgi:DNA-binding NarL/FixJ family response regulator
MDGLPMTSAAVAERGAPPIRVLVVDDDDDMRLLLESLLEFEDKDLTVAGSADSGATGLRLFTDLAPDVVVCDQRMPDMTGTEMVRALRDAGHRPNVVFFSAFISDPVRREMEELEPCAVVSKDVYLRLADTIRACARAHRADRSGSS